MTPAKRHAYDADFKLQAIAHAAKHGNRDAGRKFQVTGTMVRRWREQERELREAKEITKRFLGSEAGWPQLEYKMASGKRLSYEADFKLQAIAHAVKHGNRDAARRFKVNESMVRKWRQQENDLHQVKKTTHNFQEDKAKWPQLEDKIEHWVVEQKAAGRTISALDIRNKAATLAQSMSIDDFKGDSSWCFRFMRRRNICTSSRTTVSKVSPKLDSIPSTVDVPVLEYLTVEKRVTETGSELAIISNESPNELQPQDFKMVPAKKRSYDTDFKLQVIAHAVKHGNRDAARTFKVGESLVRSWRKQENKLRQPKKTKNSFQRSKASVKTYLYDPGFKLQAISHAVKHGNRDAARKFNVNESTVRGWRQQENKLRQQKKATQSVRGRKARWPQLEDTLEHWASEQYAAGKKISALDIRNKATILAQSMNINDFKGDRSWCVRFMKRRKICTNKRTMAATVSEQSPKSLKVKLSICSRRRKNKFPQKMVQPDHIDDTTSSTVDVPIPQGVTVIEPQPPSNSEIAIIPNESANELQLPDVDVNEVKVELRTALEYWMTKCEQSLNASGGQQEVNYSTICQWIVEAWANLSPSTVVQAFTKAGIITKLQCNSNDTELKKEERNLRVLDAIVAQLLKSGTKEEDSEGV